MQIIQDFLTSSFSTLAPVLILALVLTMLAGGLVRGWGGPIVVLARGITLVVILLAILAALPFLLLTWAYTIYPETRKHAEAAVDYRFVVELTVDGQVVEGTAVQRIEFVHDPTSTRNDVSLIRTRIEGNPINIPLPNGQELLISMRLMPNKNIDYATFFTTACGIKRNGFEHVKNFISRIGQFSGRCTVKETQLPIMVLTSGRNATASIRQVRNMSGPGNPIIPGVIFRAAYVETTTLPVSSGIETMHPWMKQLTDIGWQQFSRRDWLGDDKGDYGGYKGDVDGALGF